MKRKYTLANKRTDNSRNHNHITTGGYAGGNSVPDIIMQMPEIFFFDIKKFIDAVRSAQNIEYSYRTELYNLYESYHLDLHLEGIINKRLRGVTRFPIEFHKADGTIDEEITRELRSPWFKKLRKEIVDAQFWGFSAFQFYLDEDNHIRYISIPRKNFNPVTRQILKNEGDLSGIPMEAFDNTMMVGESRELGLLMVLMIGVLYKRGNISDWAKYCNIFGMPIREYTYPAGDEEARKKLLLDARKQGVNAVYIHPEGSNMNIIESSQKSGSTELYSKFCEYFDKKMSVLVLGNTLTTEAQDTGTQALGTVHQDEENNLNADDREYILDVLNYQMLPIFENLGYNVAGGEFVYAEQGKVDTEKQITIVEKLNAMGLPMDDDYLYETFHVTKPKDYDYIKQQKEAQKQALREALNNPHRKEDEDDLNTVQKSFKNNLRSFFGLAPKTTKGADTDF